MKPIFWILIVLGVIALIVIAVVVNKKMKANKTATALKIEADKLLAANAAVTQYQEGVENQYFAAGGQFR